MNTFKYFSEEAASYFLKDLTVRVTPPNEYNDPFECRPKIYAIKHTKAERKLSIDLFHRDQKHISPFISEQEKDKYKHEVKTNLRDVLCNKIGTICFTQDTNEHAINALMWSHYANSHKGIAIKLKSDCEEIKHSNHIKYVNNVRSIGLDKLEKNNLFIADVFFKSKDWEYEKEIRLAQELSRCNCYNNIYTTDIDINSISCIYLGANSSDSLRTKAENFYSKYKIPVYIISISDSNFSFQVKPLYI